MVFKEYEKLNTEESSDKDILTTVRLPELSETNTDTNADTNNGDVQVSEATDEDLRRSARRKKTPNRFDEWSYMCISSSNDPLSYQEPIDSPDSRFWLEAMNVEIDSIVENDVWSLVKSANGHRTINCKWVYKRQFGADGLVKSYKARLVAQGYTE